MRDISCWALIPIYKQISSLHSLNLDNPIQGIYGDFISSVYPKELTLNKANISDTSAAFLDLDLSADNGKILQKITTNWTILILT